MRSAVMALLVLALLHLLAAGGFVAWLHGSDRLDRDRLQKLVDLFTPTLAQEAQRQQEAQRLAAEAAARVKLEASLRRVGEGPRSVAQDLEAQQVREVLADLRADRVEQEIRQLRDRFQQSQRQIEERLAAVKARELALQQRLDQEKRAREDKDFKLALQMYEAMKPRQAKQAFATLIAQGQRDQVVAYLAVMEARKAAALLKEFKEPAEIALAAELIEGLRLRGVRWIEGLTAPAEPPAPSAPAPEAPTPGANAAAESRA